MHSDAATLPADTPLNCHRSAVCVNAAGHLAARCQEQRPPLQHLLDAESTEGQQRSVRRPLHMRSSRRVWHRRNSSCRLQIRSCVVPAVRRYVSQALAGRRARLPGVALQPRLHLCTDEKYVSTAGNRSNYALAADWCSARLHRTCVSACGSDRGSGNLSQDERQLRGVRCGDSRYLFCCGAARGGRGTRCERRMIRSTESPLRDCDIHLGTPYDTELTFEKAQKLLKPGASRFSASRCHCLLTLQQSRRRTVHCRCRAAGCTSDAKANCDTQLASKNADPDSRQDAHALRARDAAQF